MCHSVNLQLMYLTTTMMRWWSWRNWQWRLQWWWQRDDNDDYSEGDMMTMMTMTITVKMTWWRWRQRDDNDDYSEDDMMTMTTTRWQWRLQWRWHDDDDSMTTVMPVTPWLSTYWIRVKLFLSFLIWIANCIRSFCRKTVWTDIKFLDG